MEYKSKRLAQRNLPENKIKKSEYMKKYYTVTKDKRRTYNKEYYLKNVEKRNTKRRNFSRTASGKQSRKKVNSTRRKLDFVVLNNYFSKSNAHHINNKYVIYIPQELHRKHPHNHNKLESMIKINTLAFEFLLYGKVGELK